MRSRRDKKLFQLYPELEKNINDLHRQFKKAGLKLA